jgi:hypothetical protein
MAVAREFYVSSYYFYICVLILLLYMCPHTPSIYVSSYSFNICVLMLSLYMCPHTPSMCPHTPSIYVSSYSFYIYVLILLLYMCPYTPSMSICVLILGGHLRLRGEARRCARQAQECGVYARVRCAEPRERHCRSSASCVSITAFTSTQVQILTQ